jgi:DNA end-binding protein Ku
MARALWSGSINFGLVNIPVKMYSATRAETIRFHQIHEKTKCRVHHKLYCPDVGEIPSDEVVKGYEVAPDQYVIVSDEELEALAPEATRLIEISSFVEPSSIDPVYYERPYYLLPDERAAKAYRLLVAAMTNSEKVGVAKVVMRNREYVAALRPIRDVICLEIMRFADEIIQPETLGAPKTAAPGDKELKMAQQLIESLTDKFQPEAYHDEYSDRIQELIDRKTQGKEIVTEPPTSRAGGKVISLIAALERSLAKARKKESPKAAPKTRKVRTAKSG